LITSLSIKNFALIDDLQLSTDAGFSILTGETGAGKSIILGALSLLLGKRADLDAIRNRDKKCVVEGEFDISDYKLKKVFDDNDLDYEGHSIIRREILPSGKSRGFVNDTPIRVKQMQALGKYLVDIHSQNEASELIEGNYKFNVIDALASNETLLKEYSVFYKELQVVKKEFQKFKAEEKEAASTHDYDLFLLQELEKAELEPGKQNQLEQHYEALNNVEVLKENLGGASNQLSDEEIGVLSQLREISQRLNKIQDYGTEYKGLSERLNSVLVEAEDIVMEIENQNDTVEDDPQQLQTLNEQLQEIYNLQQKHHTNDEAELLEIQQNLQKRVDAFVNSEGRLKKLEEKIEGFQKKADGKAQKLSKNRQQAAPKFTKAVEKLVAEMGMPEAELKVEFSELETLSSLGKDKMDWLLKANRGSRFQSLEKAASGGEQSRIILAIKSIMAKYQHQPTIVFDEIDTGVSGDIAKKMGVVMQELAEKRQVISITHLPQIAAKGQHHFKVYKEHSKGVTTTNIKKLSETDRIAELAGMLGGQEQSESARAHAESLMKSTT
jgi:DNA repair protein RecN (Recombination protein N)